MPSMFIPPSLPTPLSLAEIERRRTQSMYRLHVWKQNGRLLKVIMVALGLLMITTLGLFIPTSQGVNNLVAGLDLVVFLCSFALMSILDLMADSFAADPLNLSQCHAMLEMLRTLPDGETFRKTVVGQGRAFTQAEFDMVWRASLSVEEHETSLQNTEACKVLYGSAA